MVPLPPIPPCPAVVSVSWHLSIGMFIGILGFLGVVVPLVRTEMGKKEKAFWVAALALLLYFELRSINLDQIQAKREADFAQCENQRRFDEAARENQQQFESTMKEVSKVFDKTNDAADTAKEAVDTIMGGKGYSYIELATTDVGNQRVPTLLPFLAVKNTKVLRGLKMRVFDYAKYRAEQTAPHISSEQDLLAAVNRDAFTSDLGDEQAGHIPLLIPVGIVSDGKQQIDYIIDFSALNGIWKQELHYLRNAGGVEWANRVFWIEIPPDGNVAHAKRTVIYEDVTKDYPRVNGRVQWAIDFNKPR